MRKKSMVILLMLLIIIIPGVLSYGEWTRPSRITITESANPFNQTLNTTSNVAFNEITVNNISMKAPNGSYYNCGVSNAGVWGCT